MYNVIKFYAPFDRIKLYDENPYVNLFKGIIIQAVTDVTNTSKTNIEAKKAELEARNWIFTDNETFIQFCEFAKFEPTYIRRLAKKAIKLNRYNVKTKDSTKSRQINIFEKLQA